MPQSSKQQLVKKHSLIEDQGHQRSKNYNNPYNYHDIHKYLPSIHEDHEFQIGGGNEGLGRGPLYQAASIAELDQLNKRIDVLLEDRKIINRAKSKD